MTERQNNKVDGIIKLTISSFEVADVFPESIARDLVISLAKVFNIDITKEKADYIVDEIIKNEPIIYDSGYEALAYIIERIGWITAEYFDSEKNINNLDSYINDKFMIEEQNRKCEEIINDYKIKLGEVDISLLINPFSSIFQSVHQYAVENITYMTISLAKVFNKDITKEEAKKIVSVLKDTEKRQDIESIGWAIANYFLPRKIEKIINSYEEKYKKEFEEINTLGFHIDGQHTSPIVRMFGIIVAGISFFEFEFGQSEEYLNEYSEFLVKSNNIAGENIIDLTVALSEVFNRNMTKEEAEKLLFTKDIEEDWQSKHSDKFYKSTKEFEYIIELYIKNSPFYNSKLDTIFSFGMLPHNTNLYMFIFDSVGWAITNYFDNGNKEANKINNINKINNVVENTAKEKIMTEEQKKKCEEIINSYKSKLVDVDISLLINPFSSIFQSVHQYVEITHMTISLAKVFNKDITEKEAEKIISDLREDYLKENPKDKKYKDFESMSWAIVDKLDDELILNLLILGQTGTGKSSIVNALVGDDVEKTSIGKPETPKERKNEAGEIERGIYPHSHEIDGKKVVIYDSWGLEVDKATEWEDIIEEELKKRSEDKDIKDWFHSVTYCIQAGGYKIQDFDIKMIKLFMDKKYNVIVALTKSDQIGKAKREKFIKEIEKAIKIKIITYRALIKSNLINEVKKEFIKEIEKEIGEIEFEQIEETKSDMYPIAAARVPIFITAIPPINLKYDNIVKGLMKSNQIEQSKIEKFIKEIVKEIKETTKIGITVIPISANPEQLDNMTEKPKPSGLEEYKAAILLSWEKIFIDRIPLHIIEKLKKDIENAKYNAPNRKPKDDDDLKILAKEIQEYFNNVVKENLQSRIKENFEKYYKITEDIININTDIDISNFYSRKNIDPDTYLYDYIGFSISHLFEHIKDLFKYLYNRIKIKENIEEFINKTYEETKEYISEKKFEDNIRKSIIDIFNNIENKKN